MTDDITHSSLMEMPNQIKKGMMCVATPTVETNLKNRCSPAIEIPRQMRREYKHDDDC